MIKVDEDILGALARLSDNSDYKLVVGWFERSFKSAQSQLRYETDGTRLRQAQGACQELHEIVNLAGTAPALLRKMRDSRELQADTGF